MEEEVSRILAAGQCAAKGFVNLVAEPQGLPDVAPEQLAILDPW